jgi:hypothetical protein
MTSSLNLGSLFGEIQCKLEKSITSMLNDVHLKNSEYKELHDNIMSLPVVAKLFDENKMLREKLAEYENKKICLEVVEKDIPINTKKIIYTNSGESMITDDLCNCDLCPNIVNCLRQNIFILTRGDDEEMVLCVDCFEEQKIRLKTDHWKSDDFSEAETSDVESDSDSSEEEEEEVEKSKRLASAQYRDRAEKVVLESLPFTLCNNRDCSRYPPDWDFDEDTEDTYNVGQWQKCNICDGYFNDDRCEDILYIEEEPNNQKAGCNLCGKVKNIVRMKGTGKYICGNTCDEEEEVEEEEPSGEEEVEEEEPSGEEEVEEEEPSGEEEVEEPSGEEELEKTFTLCENMDCERYPPDWDTEQDTEETYQEDQWKKCCLCDGYFNDDGMGDILYVQEEPNNQEAGCSLCGKTKDIVQMKGTGQYICGNACDESDEEEDEGDGARFGDIINNDEEEADEEEPSGDEEEEVENVEELSGEEDKVICELCNIKLTMDDIIELDRETEQSKEIFCLCENCLQDKADHLRGEGWNVDEFFEEEEAEPSGEEEEEEAEPSGEEEEEEAEPSGEEEEEDDDEEVEEIMIKQKMYYTNDVDHGSIYEDDDGEVGKKVGIFNNGNAIFN